MAVLTGGLLLLCMLTSKREQWYVPGPLTQAHSQILSNTLVSERCGLCHPNAHPKAPAGVSQSDLCMACHQAHLASTWGTPHDLHPDALQLLRNENASRLVSVSSNTDSGLSESTACAQCHIEHHGAEHDLKAMADRRCQACHFQQFQGFASGHPEFRSYPHGATRRFAFDHRAHADEYFGKSNEVFDCRRCHLDQAKQGAVGSVFRTVGFDQACAQCHLEPIRSQSVNGWAFLQVPCLPPEIVEQDSAELQDWPANALFDYDGEVSLAARILLGADAEVRPWLSLIPPSGKLAEVPQVKRAEAARALARGFRSLVNDVASGGQLAWERRITEVMQQALERELNPHERQLSRQLASGLPPDLFRQVEQQWFGTSQALTNKGNSPFKSPFSTVSDQLDISADEPLLSLESNHDLDAELLDFELGATPAAKAEVQRPQILTKLNAAQHLVHGGWYLDQEIMAIRYVPLGHADPFLAAWAELALLLERNQEDSLSTPPLWSADGLQRGELVPGGCTECHQVGTQSSKDPWANWKAASRSATAREFTKFSHTPHLSLPQAQDCRFCHAFRDSGSLESPRRLKDALLAWQSQDFEAFDSDFSSSRFLRVHEGVHEFLSVEFQPMQRDHCVSCHHPSGAGDGCTQCHNYHVGSISGAPVKLDAAKQQEVSEPN